MLSAFEIWMVKQNLNYAQEEGLKTVTNRLISQGYIRVAQAVEQEYKNKSCTIKQHANPLQTH